jgi:predicted nucleic acid-binding protein
VHPYEPLLARAVDVSSQSRAGLYDCLYVALAEREGCELVTDDQKLIGNLRQQFPFIVPLASLP